MADHQGTSSHGASNKYALSWLTCCIEWLAIMCLFGFSLSGNTSKVSKPTWPPICRPQMEFWHLTYLILDSHACIQFCPYEYNGTVGSSFLRASICHRRSKFTCPKWNGIQDSQYYDIHANHDMYNKVFLKKYMHGTCVIVRWLTLVILIINKGIFMENLGQRTVLSHIPIHWKRIV